MKARPSSVPTPTEEWLPSPEQAPQAAVARWWAAWQDQDIGTLRELALPDYIEYSGAGERRTIGRSLLLAIAEGFFGNARIDEWGVFDFEIRQHGDVALCSYTWTESGTKMGVAFDLHGLATDVLVRRNGAWRYQLHHVSMLK